MNITCANKPVNDVDLARRLILNSGYAIVVVKNSVVLSKRRGKGIQPFLEAIEELQHTMYGSIIGDRMLGKASALLCVYVKAKEVYALHATPKAKDVLKKHEIYVRVDKTVDHIRNKTGDGFCPFEKLLKNVDSPREAYEVLKKTLYE